MSLSAIQAALAQPLNIVFLTALFAVVAWALWPRPNSDRGNAHRLRVAPGVLVSLGILGTFTGILIGLLGFDVTDLEGSVPRLLEGMKTAFVSSVSGLSLALVVRGVATYRQRGRTGGTPTTATLADVHGTLARIDGRLTEGLKQVGDEVASLTKAIGGEGDSTLIGRIKLMHLDQKEASAANLKALNEFAEKVSELGSKALIEALQRVIQDFNKNLTEQFGDNFKHLNAGVEKLVQWQVEYRQHLETMQNRLEAATASMQTAEQSLQAVVTAVSPLPSVHQQLLTVIAKLEQENNALEARLAQFAALGRQAVEALPVVQSNIDQLTTGFTKTITEGVGQLQAAQRMQMQSKEALTAAFLELRTGTGTLISSNAEQQKVLQRTFAETLTALETQLRAMHTQSAKHWQEILKEQVERQQDAVRQQLERLDDTLKQQMVDSMDRLSAHLLGLHQKLVQDYEPLLGSIRHIVEVGQRGVRQ